MILSHGRDGVSMGIADAVCSVPRRCDSVAYVAAPDILTYMPVHCWLAEIPRYQLSSLESSKMSRLRVVTK